MKFKDQKSAKLQMIQSVCLLLSLGAIFSQIWVLIVNMELLFQGEYDSLWAGLLLSSFALACCAVTAWITTLDLFKPSKTK